MKRFFRRQFAFDRGDDDNYDRDHSHDHAHDYDDHGIEIKVNRQKESNKNLHHDPALELQLSVLPSKNNTLKFLHCFNKTFHNNMRPVSNGTGKGVSGCWLIFRPVSEIDEAWLKVKKATEAGQLGYRSNVRTIKDDETGIKTISVCTYNAFDVNDVLRVRQALQNLGFTADNEGDKLQYKTIGETEEDIHYEDHEGAYVSLHRDFKLI